jgi:abnormal spindle-like microcephaly-associated protein
MRHSVTRLDVVNKQPTPGGYSTLPYVTTNDMYDEKWIDKQERSFSQWLNHEFNVTVDAFSAKDPSSWSYYSHKLEFEHTRAAACKIYQSDAFRIVLRKVEESIGRDRLQLRPDCNLVGEVKTRREIIDLFFSFDIRWLVLGLETITGKATAINPNFDRGMISGFINKVSWGTHAT